MEKLLTVQMLVSILTLITVVHVILLGVAYLIYVERKIASYIQDRVGPNRVGFDFGLPILAPLKGALGLGQPLADGIKFLIKEDYQPRHADRWLFSLAPIAIIIPALIGFAVIPWGGVWNAPDLNLLGLQITGGEVLVAGAPINVGVVYLLAVASLGIYGVVLGGWASNNKFSFLGGLRASAQMISYEVPMGLALLTILLMAGTVLPEMIIRQQVDGAWFIFTQPIAAIIFFICMLAEANRAPFDNAEAESELVGGYHTEYSSMRFALFFLAEYAHLITSSAFFALLFLGGWDPIPFASLFPADSSSVLVVLAKAGVFAGKIFTLVVLTMIIRWTLPRMRYDQVMRMAWQAVIPIGLIILVGTTVMIHKGWTGLVPMVLFNAATLVAALALAPLVAGSPTNRRIPLAGSRFSPQTGDDGAAAPLSRLARADAPRDPLTSAESPS